MILVVTAIFPAILLLKEEEDDDYSLLRIHRGFRFLHFVYSCWDRVVGAEFRRRKSVRTNRC